MPSVFNIPVVLGESAMELLISLPYFLRHFAMLLMAREVVAVEAVAAALSAVAAAVAPLFPSYLLRSTLRTPDKSY